MKSKRHSRSGKMIRHAFVLKLRICKVAFFLNSAFACVPNVAVPLLSNACRDSNCSPVGLAILCVCVEISLIEFPDLENGSFKVSCFLNIVFYCVPNVAGPLVTGLAMIPLVRHPVGVY